MTKRFVANKKDRTMWACCIAAYILIADWYSPCSIVRADLDDGSLVNETPFGKNEYEDKLITILANLAIFASLDPDTYKMPTVQIPESIMAMIAELLNMRGETSDQNAVRNECENLLAFVSEILRTHHMYHLRLAAALMKGSLDTCMIESLKTMYCNDYDDVA
ncbi:hypothetical protein [Aristaeella lactis]|uniref:Uncharacterized protein n=1 Tax=Aristaeella lactis TaxID=3046383 RepID=A0AC61PLK6_9FIRM|nr:hypothetical protein [Aristaeella lactis]QUA54647.1 hypothetical protein JYE50_15450 [Aristaeella lactis]SMC64006.1 hypothetical protein SAMN06297397_1710 [Aristaeella lactis]